MQFNYKVWNDAGLLREYTFEHYGYVLCNGGPASERHWATKFCQRLARLSGQTIDKVVADVRADYRSMDHDMRTW